MSATLTFKERLLAEILPTKGQIIMAVVLSLIIIVIAQSRSILDLFGVDSGALHTISEQFHVHFDGILRSQIASQAAIIAFWATVGLISYLICWAAYNFFVEARNEVTLNTVYTNRGHWRSPFYTLGLKAAAAVGLGAAIITLWYGLSLWISFVGAFLFLPGVMSGLLALVGVIGAAIQLYAVLALIQLTFTPWYRAEAFTEK